MGLRKDMQKAFGIIQKEELHPPRAPPKPIVSETSDSVIKRFDSSVNVSSLASESDSKLAIDFSYLTTNSSFQRAILEFIKKYIPGFEDVKVRGSKEYMVTSFNANYMNYKACMSELKEKLKERRIE